ncbi:MAG: hypothetical protein WD740_07890 [Anaerolineales bacterium]
MKIGFLLLRDTFLKTMGSLIQASINRNHQVYLFTSDELTGGSKAYQRITPEKLSTFSQHNVELAPLLLKDLGKLKEKFLLDVLVTHEGYYVLNEYLTEIQRARKSGVKVISLTHFYENSMRLIESLNYFDKTYYLSRFAVDIHFRLYGNGSSIAAMESSYGGRVEAMGSPMFDQLKSINAKSVRTEFGIPQGMRVVILFAPAIPPETRWRFRVWGQASRLKRIQRAILSGKWTEIADAVFVPTMEEIINATREFCDRNHAFLVVKSRAKQRDAECLKTQADLYLSGEEDTHYPVFTSYKLLAIADVCIGVMSMSMLEAAAMQVPAWNIYVPSAELDYPPSPLYPKQKQYHQAILSKDQEGPFNYPGVITNIEPRNILKWLRENGLDNAQTDPRAAATYAQKYLGITDKPSSDRILDSLELLHSFAKMEPKEEELKNDEVDLAG